MFIEADWPPVIYIYCYWYWLCLSRSSCRASRRFWRSSRNFSNWGRTMSSLDRSNCEYYNSIKSYYSSQILRVGKREQEKDCYKDKRNIILLTSKGGNPGPREKSKAGTLGAVHRSSSETSVTFIILINTSTAFYTHPIKKACHSFSLIIRGTDSNSRKFIV